MALIRSTLKFGGPNLKNLPAAQFSDPPANIQLEILPYYTHVFLDDSELAKV
jgi:hypothetical protein